MISQPVFGDRALSDSLYRALLNRFYDSLNSSTQAILDQCNLGFAPSPEGVKTFFIVAPSIVVAEQLLQNIEILISRVSGFMIGVKQLAVCMNPTQTQADTSAERQEKPIFPPRFMACQFFPIPVAEELLND